VPRVAPVLEQWMRAERMQARGLLRSLHPDELTPESLIEAVVAELSRDDADNSSLQRFRMEGLPRIGAALAALLNRDARPQRPAAMRAAVAPRAGVNVRLPLAGAMQRAFANALGA
jgi:predicted glycosyltransferase